MNKQATKTTRIAPGRYTISREDGYAITVQKSGSTWYMVGTMRREKSRSAFEYDMASGYMPQDTNWNQA
jgi:hypothetical protein